VTEQQLSEIERVLLYVGDARSRAARAASELARAGAPAYAVDAVRETEERMAKAYRTLSQRTYYRIAS
jgi:hypothetical protein